MIFMRFFCALSSVIHLDTGKNDKNISQIIVKMQAQITQITKQPPGIDPGAVSANYKQIRFSHKQAVFKE